MEGKRKNLRPRLQSPVKFSATNDGHYWQGRMGVREGWDGMGVRKDEEEEEGNQKERRTSNLPTLLFPSSVFSGN